MAEPLTSLTGVSSGMDWRSLVDTIIKAERVPADKLKAAIDANTKRREALKSFQATVQALRDATTALTGATAGSSTAFDSFSVTTSGSDANGRTVLAATASVGAVPGSYGVKVTSLATAQKWTGAAGRAPTANLDTWAGTTLSLSKGGTPVTPAITIGTGWTLATLRDEIAKLNTGTAPSGVQASLVNVSATEQRLVLGAAASGVANGFDLDDGGSGLLATLGLDAAARAANPALVQHPSDAAFVVDGVPMTRTTNVVSDVLPGVTMTLSATGDSAITVGRLASAPADAMKTFVDAFNKVQAQIAASGKVASPLYGDPLVRTVRGNLASTYLTGAPPESAPGGVAGVADDLTRLTDVGLTLQRDGTLKLDTAAFQGAAEKRLPNVQAMLKDRLGAFATYAESIAKPIAGSVDLRSTNLEVQSSRMESRIADIDARLEKRKAALLAQYSKFEGSLGRLKAIGDQMTAQFAGLNAKRD